MKVFTALRCTSSLPDDQVEDGPRIIQPGGRAVACALSELLQGMGLNVSNPTLDGEHGWALTASENGSKYWILVTDLDDEKIIQTKDVSFFLGKLFRVKKQYIIFLCKLRNALVNDARFGSVSWFSYGK